MQQFQANILPLKDVLVIATEELVSWYRCWWIIRLTAPGGAPVIYNIPGYIYGSVQKFITNLYCLCISEVK